MSTPQQATAAIATVTDPNKALDAILDKSIEYIPFLSEQTIMLTPRMVIRFMCKPTRSGKRATMEQALHFCMLCKARGLNPWEGDAYIVGYDTKDGPEFSLITAHQAFLKRAEVHPEYDGMQSGVIVLRGDEVREEEGDFCLDDDVLLGGWAKVLFKTRSTPVYKRLRLSTFNKGFGRWNVDPAGMIVKCAEADGLRSAFPNSLGGMYLEDEMPEKGDAKGEVFLYRNGEDAQRESNGTIEAPRRKSEVIDVQPGPGDDCRQTSEIAPAQQAVSDVKPVDEAVQKKSLRKSIKERFTEDQIEKHTGGRDINALSLDELVQLNDGLSEYKA
ncbi:MAG TPA: phage recombination protein Bet [Polyangiaceae bacterium]|nr:phage recombination protein Bet [Polyangiaceae bacterium]